MKIPLSLEQLIDEFAKLPGIGRKTAKRLAFSLLLRPEREAISLANAITKSRQQIKHCEQCFGFTEETLCLICSDQRRNHEIVCVVEDPKNIFTIEENGVFNGVYHVLQGAISPLHGIPPEKLRIEELKIRIQNSSVRELILATNPTLEGEATAHFLMDLFQTTIPLITRIARGMPSGGDLEFADSNTLIRAFEARTPLASL